MTKRCTQCGDEKALDQFSKSAIASDGLHTWCKACKAKRTREWMASNQQQIGARERARYAADGRNEREQARRWHHDNRDRSLLSKRAWKLRQYGLTAEDYTHLFAAQGGKCAVCRCAYESARSRDLYVDHCHETGVVRGLLCRTCNLGLGHLGDSPSLLRAAAEYLEQTKARRSA